MTLRGPMRRVATNGVHLAIDDRGVGLPVLFVHGLLDLGFSFRHQMPALVAAGFRAIAPDLRGHGESDLGDPPWACSLASLAADVVGILDALDIERAVIAGHDDGARVAYALARIASGRVAGVVGFAMPCSTAPPVPPTALWRAALGDSFYLLALGEARAHARLAADVDRTLRYFFRTARGLGRGERPPFDVPGLALLDELEQDESRWTRPSVLSPEDHAIYREAFARAGFHASCARARSLDGDASYARGRIERIDVPTLFVAGEHDALVPVQNTVAMRELCSDLERVVVADAGHLVHQEHPATVNDVLVSWLRRRLGGLS